MTLRLVSMSSFFPGKISDLHRLADLHRTESGFSHPAMIFISVDFPLPLGPIYPILSFQEKIRIVLYEHLVPVGLADPR